MKHVMVTGAAGQLGRRLVSDLLAEKYRVTAVSHDNALQELRSLDDGERLYLSTCNLADTEETAKLAASIETINILVHIENVPPSDPDDHTICTKRIDVSINLISLFGDKIDHAVIGSSAGVYGDNVNGAVSEDSPAIPTTYHGASLLTGEKFWNLFAINSGKPVAILRFAQNEADPTVISRSVLSAVRDGKDGLLTISVTTDT